MKRSLDDQGMLKEGLESVAIIAHSYDKEDPMGVKKGWLMS